MGAPTVHVEDRSVSRKTQWVRAGLVLLAAAGLCWPALWNGYPLLCPDSIGYLGDGREVWAGLMGWPVGPPVYRRAELYSLVLYWLGAEWSAWPGIVFQAVVCAWIVWLTVRACVERTPERTYALLMLVLCMCTGAAWFASWLMADVAGPILYLGLALTVFAGDTLQRWERVAVLVVCTWAIAAHTTHLLVAAAVLMVLALAWLLKWAAMRGRGRGLAMMAGVTLLSVGLQTVVHLRVDGNATGAQTPPFLLARALSDGPARVYLREHCAALEWTICRYQAKLTDEPADFLWAADGVWYSVTEAEQTAMRRETKPLLLATVRTYPKAQLLRSWANVVMQLSDYRLLDFGSSAMVARRIRGLLPHGGAVYARTRQAQDAMPMAVFSCVQSVVIPIAAVVILLLLPGGWRDPRYAGLAAVVLTALFVNAAVTGVVSGVYARYQARVVWLVVVLAGVLVARALEQRAVRKARG